MPGATGAHVPVRRVLCRAARVTDRGRPHTWHLPELAFGAPEATHPEHRALQAFGKRRLDGMTVDEVRDSHTASIRRAVRWVTLSHGGAPRHLRQHSQGLDESCAAARRRRNPARRYDVL